LGLTSITVAAAVLAAILAAAVLVLWRARSAGIGLHRQIDDLRQEVGKAREDQKAWAATIEQAIHTSITNRANQLQSNLRGTHAGIIQLQRDLEALAARNEAFATSTQQTLDVIARMPAKDVLVHPALAEPHSEAELIAFAESIAILRPLVPYPKWRTDAERHNPDFSYQLRRWFWQYFHDRRRDAPIVVRWHDNTRLRLCLGNDLTAQIYIAGCWEPNEFAFLDRILRPGMTFVDAGANDGIYTVFAAQRVGAGGLVWAFEPSPRELERLCCNLELNHLAARVFPLALADVEGQAELMLGGYEHEGHNTLGAFAYSEVESAGKVAVRLRRLDDIVAEDAPARMDVLKLDVEGAELRLLRGATATLERYRPVVLFEASEPSLRNQGASGAELIEFFGAQRFTIYSFDPDTGTPAAIGNTPFSNNLIALPEEKQLPATVHQPWPTPPGA
jgi:FkbM family methyltransferase